ncbi:MAG: ABC transporter substrate-binding protein, partial [Actinomycetota bacterium]|nr:ABC transporter substrate-binding protein [Actinomycetota bacterium]
MRIVSLVPHATELLFALGLGDAVVGVTHECDHPTQARRREPVTRDRLPTGLSAAEIDAAVRARTERGESIYELDQEALHTLEPDLIVTQALCAVCAVSHDEVEAIAARMPVPPAVISLDPSTFGETLADVRTVAQATGTRDAALELIARTGRRVDAVRRAVRD